MLSLILRCKVRLFNYTAQLFYVISPLKASFVDTRQEYTEKRDISVPAMEVDMPRMAETERAVR